jgi:hypothetical protein
LTLFSDSTTLAEELSILVGHHRITGERPNWRQLQRIKDCFVTRRKGSRTARATKWELLRETRKGRIGLPSQYRLSGIATVVQQGDAGLLSQVLWRLAAYPPEEADEAFSLAATAHEMAADGPGASGTDSGPGGAKRTHEEPFAPEQ